MAGKSNFENVNDLLKAALWPIIAVIVFFSYKDDIGKVIGIIPKKFEDSSKITMGSITLEIEKTARSSGNAELGKIIKNLSERGISKLLTLGQSSHMVMYNTANSHGGPEEHNFKTPSDMDVLLELEKNGLLTGDGSVEEFFDFVKSLDHTTEVVYAYPDGTESQSSSDDAFRVERLKIEHAILSKQQYKKLDDYTVRLSDDGRKAFEIVIKVIADQIKATE